MRSFRLAARDAAGKDILDSSRVEPNLAESWAVDADGQRYARALRADGA